MKEITKKQLAVFEFIKDFIFKKKYPPTINEIARGFDISNTGAVMYLKALERKGFIKREKDKSRSIIILTSKQ